MSINLWLFKRLMKRIGKKERQILKFKIAIDTLNEWIEQDKQKLNKRLGELTVEENLEYGIQCGFIDEAELKIIRRKGKWMDKKSGRK